MRAIVLVVLVMLGCGNDDGKADATPADAGNAQQASDIAEPEPVNPLVSCIAEDTYLEPCVKLGLAFPPCLFLLDYAMETCGFVLSNAKQEKLLVDCLTFLPVESTAQCNDLACKMEHGGFDAEVCAGIDALLE